MSLARLIFAVGVSWSALAVPTAVGEQPVSKDELPVVSPRLTAAQGLLLRGSYAEATEAFAALSADLPAQAALGSARCLVQTGKRDEAIAALKEAIEENGIASNAGEKSESARLQSELAVLQFASGKPEEAAAATDAALKLDANSLAARWVQAELLRISGKLEQAKSACEWFVDHYNQHQDRLDPDGLRYVGLAAAQLARWQRNAKQFGFLVNSLYPDALELDKNYWPAPYEAGLLFLEKFNEAQAAKKFEQALAINPRAAEVHAAIARLALQNYDLDRAKSALDRALEINPQLIEAHQLRADCCLANFQTAEAAVALATALELNPLDEETLGRQAALALLSARSGNSPQAAAIVEQIDARNPHAGRFYHTLAETLSLYRKFPQAERYYRQAIERMPQLPGPHGQLGLLYMRLGREVEAKELLDLSFEIDPFNVRVKNTLEVLDVLAGYATLETEHFIIKYDRGADEILAHYVASHLEKEVYPQLTRQFGFTPQGKTLFEIFNKAKNTGAHGWFSARMVGLPYIGTVGACAGKMVALASPNALDQPYNWARVVRHEFIHVLNLQQTNFNIPHWFTEAIATHNEGFPRSEEWNRLLAARSASGELFNLDDINLGFIRPASGDDWQLAYCQAELYAEFMLAEYGQDAIARLLSAYADGLPTPQAIERCFQLSQAEFETGYSKYLAKLVAELPASLRHPPSSEENDPAKLSEQLAAAPENPDLLARVALAHWDDKKYAEARKRAEAALKLRPTHQLAGYVRARVHLLVGEQEEAEALLARCLDEKSPDERLLRLLAGIKLQAKDYAAAEKLYQLGAGADPLSPAWPKALAAVYLRSGDKEKLGPVLAGLAEADADEFLIPKKLAQLAQSSGDHAAAAKWANRALHVNVLDTEVHTILAAALAAQRDFIQAIEGYEILVKMKPGQAEFRVALAQAYVGAEKPEDARRVLAELLELEPNHPQAKQVLETLK